MLLLVVLAAPAGTEPLQQGKLVGALDAKTLVIMCSGVAADTEAAILHARQGCMEWFVLNYLTFTKKEKDAYRAKRDKIFTRLDEYVERPVPGGRGEGRTGIRGRVTISSTMIRVTLIVKLYKRALRQELAALGVIPRRDPDDPNNLAVSIFPSRSMEKSPHRKTVEALLSTYFTESGWRVATGCKKVSRGTLRALEATREDWDAQSRCALVTGSDVIVEFDAVAHREKSGGFESISYSVNLAARETACSALLAAGSAMSAPRALFRSGEKARAAALRESSMDALIQIERELTAFARKQADQGRAVTLHVANAPPNADLGVHRVIVDRCSVTKKQHSRKDRVLFVARCKPETPVLLSDLKLALEKKYPGARIEARVRGRKLILLRFKQAGSEEP